MIRAIFKEIGMLLLVLTGTLAIMASPIIARLLSDYLHPEDSLNTLPPTYGNITSSCSKHP